MIQKTAVIVEDEFPARLRMQQLLSDYHDKINILGEADTGKKAISLIEEEKPDVVFLDIQLPDMTGFDLLEKISYNPWIIFTTAYSEFALQAFEKYAIDYLVKPIEKDRLEKAITKLTDWESQGKIDLHLVKEMIQNIQPSKQPLSLAIKKKDKIVLVDYKNIAFFQADDKYVNVHLKDGKQHLLSKSLTQLTETLPNDFIRVHRSYIINKNYIVEIHKYFKGKFMLQLSDVHLNKITTGETYTSIVKEAFGL